MAGLPLEHTSLIEDGENETSGDNGDNERPVSARLRALNMVRISYTSSKAVKQVRINITIMTISPRASLELSTYLALRCVFVVWGRSVLPKSFRVPSLALAAMVAPMPMKQPWQIWVNISRKSTKNRLDDKTNKTKHWYVYIWCVLQVNAWFYPASRKMII